MFGSKSSIALAVVGVLSLGASAQAKLIDTFHVNQAMVVSGNNEAEFESVENGMLGGERDVTLAGRANPGNRRVRVNTNPFGEDLLVYEAGSRAEASFTLDYDGNEFDNMEQPLVTDGLGSEDLTDSGSATGFVVDLVSTDANLSMDFHAWSNAGNKHDAATLNIPDGGSGGYALPFSAFSGVDFTDVSALQVSVDAPAGLDLTIEQIATASAPAPAALPGGLMLMGALGLARFRRRRPIA